jgi:hypothetical protein
MAGTDSEYQKTEGYGRSQKEGRPYLGTFVRRDH